MQGLAGQTAIAGVSLHQYTRGQSPLPEHGILVRAIVEACEEAGFDPADVDGFATYGDDHNEPVRLMRDLGTKELSWSSAVFGGGGGGLAGAVGQAAAAIITGQASAVVVYRALVQSNSGRLSAAVMAHHLNYHAIGAGILAPAQICALRAQRMFDHHNIPHSTVEAFVRAAYHHGANNPRAVSYGKPFDPQKYETARWIAEPFRLMDCSRENDGAGALLLVSAERARDLNQNPVYVQAVAQGGHKGWGDLLENDHEEDYATAGFRVVAQRLWQRSGLKPADIDVAQIYENFSAQGVASLIDHGFCTHADAAEIIQFDNLIAPAGKLPINTSGGNLAQGFVHGINIAVEAVHQLRGQSANPVPGAKTCLVAGGPGAPLVSSAILTNEEIS